MTEWTIISTRDAIQMLRADRVVYAVETPDGAWGVVRSIDDVLEQGLRVPAHRISFASGHVRLATGNSTFRVERE